MAVPRRDENDMWGTTPMEGDENGRWTRYDFRAPTLPSIGLHRVRASSRSKLVASLGALSGRAVGGHGITLASKSGGGLLPPSSSRHEVLNEELEAESSTGRFEDADLSDDDEEDEGVNQPANSGKWKNLYHPAPPQWTATDGTMESQHPTHDDLDGIPAQDQVSGVQDRIEESTEAEVVTNSTEKDAEKKGAQELNERAPRATPLRTVASTVFRVLLGVVSILTLAPVVAVLSKVWHTLRGRTRPAVLAPHEEEPGRHENGHAGKDESETASSDEQCADGSQACRCNAAQRRSKPGSVSRRTGSTSISTRSESSDAVSRMPSFPHGTSDGTAASSTMEGVDTDSEEGCESPCAYYQRGSAIFRKSPGHMLEEIDDTDFGMVDSVVSSVHLSPEELAAIRRAQLASGRGSMVPFLADTADDVSPCSRQTDHEDVSVTSGSSWLNDEMMLGEPGLDSPSLETRRNQASPRSDARVCPSCDITPRSGTEAQTSSADAQSSPSSPSQGDRALALASLPDDPKGTAGVEDLKRQYDGERQSTRSDPNENVQAPRGEARESLLDARQLRRKLSETSVNVSDAFREVRNASKSFARSVAAKRRGKEDARFVSVMAPQATLYMIADMLSRDKDCVVSVRRNKALKLKVDRLTKTGDRIRARIDVVPLTDTTCNVVFSRAREDKPPVSPEVFFEFVDHVQRRFVEKTA